MSAPLPFTWIHNSTAAFEWSAVVVEMIIPRNSFPKRGPITTPSPSIIRLEAVNRPMKQRFKRGCRQGRSREFLQPHDPPVHDSVFPWVDAVITTACIILSHAAAEAGL